MLPYSKVNLQIQNFIADTRLQLQSSKKMKILKSKLRINKEFSLATIKFPLFSDKREKAKKLFLNISRILVNSSSPYFDIKQSEKALVYAV